MEDTRARRHLEAADNSEERSNLHLDRVPLRSPPFDPDCPTAAPATIALMSPKSFLLSPALHAYLMEHCPPLDEVQRDLIAETAALGGVSGMQIAPEQGALMTLLTRLIDARHAVEVGTFTGYSSLCIARGLGKGGRLLCCDVSEEWTAIARRAWERDGVQARIDLRIAPAVETLRSLPADEQFDLAFIDADKGSYIAYWEEIVPRLRSGGVILVDNVLWSGRVLGEGDSADDDANLVAIRGFNEHAAADSRVESLILPIADGMTLGCRR